jgi:hypothetical protein
MEKRVEHTCPHCGNKFEITIYPVINLQSDEHLYKDLFSLDLFKIKCSKCKKVTLIQYDMFVIDMFKKYIINLYVTKNVSKFINDKTNLINGLLANPVYKDVIDKVKYTRIVTSLNELLEKLLIFDYDLNDKLIEIMKLSVYEKDRLDKNIYTNICFDKIQNDELLFTCFNINDNKITPVQVGISVRYYNTVIEMVNRNT